MILSLLIAWLLVASTLVLPLRRYLLHDWHPDRWFKMPLPWLVASGLSLLWPWSAFMLARKSFLKAVLTRD